MNEKIKELIEKADLDGIADFIDCEAGHEGHGMRMFEAFALLVIKECQQCCANVENDSKLRRRAKTVSDGALLCREEINGHFGVKQ